MLDKLKKNYFLLIVTFLLIYFFFNLLGGERGLISYIEKKKIFTNLKEEQKNNAPLINVGCLTYDKSSKIELSQQAIFSRHCAVVGTTGGGKSYTVSKLIEGLVFNKNKAVLIDATGEYHKHDEKEYSEKASILSSKSFLH